MRSGLAGSDASLDIVLSIDAAVLCSAGRRFVLHTISSRKSITETFSCGSHSKSCQLVKTYEAHCEKSGLRGFRPGLTQTRLHSWIQLKA